MKIRTTQPKNNKYYIRQVNGGYNGAVLGYPTISGANVLCNCVGYANGRFNEIGDYGRCKYQLVCNAENFIESAKRQGLKISSRPVQGGIMVWQKGRTLGGGDGAGHVAVVEEVYDDGTILTSESGYGSRDWAFKNLRRSNSNGRWGQNGYYTFRGCIINPAVKNGKVAPAPKLTVDGIGGADTVRAMQKFFGTPQDGIISGQNSAQKKFYPSLKAVKYDGGGSVCVKKLQKWLGISQDGVIGKKTVKAWQKKLGADADGIFGANSMKAWQKYLNTHDKPTYPKPVEKPVEKPKEKTIGEKVLDACKAQADYMKNAKYGDYSPVTIPHSKKAGTCVTFDGCSYQRIGVLKSGEFVWHDGRGYGTGKVYIWGKNGRRSINKNDPFEVIYMNNKPFKNLKSKLKAGDMFLLDDNKSGKKGEGGHVGFLNGTWKGSDPYIWDAEPNMKCAKTGKPRTYSGKRKILAIVRLKGDK